MKGLIAEWIAMFCLCLKGYWPLRWRLKYPVGEVDLVMQKGMCIVFIEVKKRKRLCDALESITPRNLLRVQKAARHFSIKNPNLAFKNQRIDAFCLGAFFWPCHVKNVSI